MKTLFLEIDTEASWAVASLGPAFLASYLRKNGHEASFIRVPYDQNIGNLIEDIRAEAPDLIGVSLTTRQWLRAQEVIGKIKNVSNIPVIAGGLHPTFSPEEVLNQYGFDYVCLGEGEVALLEFVNELGSGISCADGHIDNIWASGGTRPKLRIPIDPLDDLPFIARDFLDEKWGVHHISTQRGCPFPCTYCAARMYDELYSSSDTGKYGRRRTQGNIISELLEIRSNGPLNYVIFLDDTFTIHHSWIRAFCELYRDKINVPFSLHARVETVNKELLAQLAAAGCKHITYGVESGSERVRREIMQRFATNQRFIDVFRWTKEVGIMVTANYMIGTPGETVPEMMETIELHKKLEPMDFGYFVFYPYPGTSLFELCRNNRWLPEDYLTLPANHRESILNLPNVTRSDIKRVYDAWTNIRIENTSSRFPSQNTNEIKADIFKAASKG
jgi:anaerobic magnesium-protoporphyrin IX monomethyl ester cyclase